MHRLIISVSVVVVLTLVGCDSEQPDFATVLPSELGLSELSGARKRLLRATLEAEGVIAESALAFSDDYSRISGIFPLDESAGQTTTAIHLRLYGRYADNTEEVLLAHQVQSIEINPKRENVLDITVPWQTDDDAVFDRNRNGISNLEDLLADVDPGPPGPLLEVGPELVEMVSGFDGDRNVIAINNLSGRPLSVDARVFDAPGTYLSEFTLEDAVPSRSLDLGTLQPFAHKLVALTFLPPNSYIQSGAVLVTAVDPSSNVRYSTSVELVGNSNDAARLQPLPSDWVSPPLPSIDYQGTSLAFPVEELFSGQAPSTSEEDAPLAYTGLRYGDLAADLIYYAAIPAGFDFYVHLWGLEHDVDLTLVPLEGGAPRFDLAASSETAGSSSEGIELPRSDGVQELLMILSVNEPELARTQPARVVDVPFFLVAHAVTGPRFSATDPIDPVSGSTLGGDSVVIRGLGFSPGAQVAFDGRPGTGEVVNGAGTEITVATPPTVFGSHLAAVRVENPSFSGVESVSITLPEAYRYIPPPPSVSSVVPPQVPLAGGTPVTIRGQNFVGDFGAPLVLFGAEQAPSVVAVDSGTLLVTSPALTAGTHDLTIRAFYAGDNVRETVAAAAVEAVAPGNPAPTITGFTPTSADSAGGELITLTGTNFVAGSTILLGDQALLSDAITFISATEMTFDSPECTPGRHSLRLVTPSGQIAVAPTTFECTGEPPNQTDGDPTVLNIYQIGGELVHRKMFRLLLEGLNFRPGQLIQVDAVAADGNAFAFATEVATESLIRLRMELPGLSAGEYRLWLSYADGYFESIPRITIANDCGNGVVDGTEQCEAGDADLCTSLGYATGDVTCGADCTWDISNCRNCGNGIREGAEQCDGTDLGGLECDDLGYLLGELSCALDCTWNTSLCVKCGNGIAETGEECDTTDIPSTCVDLGFQGGTPACDNCVIDTSGCNNCGDGICSSDEDNSTCPGDCPLGTCGNDACEIPETCTTCPADCSCETPYTLTLVSGNNQDVPRNSPAGQALVVNAADALGNPLGNITVNVTGPAGTHLPEPTLQTTSLGNAAVLPTMGLSLGPQVFEFRAYDPDSVELAGSPVQFTLTTIAPPDGTVFPLVSHVGNANPTGGAADYAAGVGSQTRLGRVYGFAVDSAGNLIFADNTYHRVFQLSPEGQLTLVAGGNGAGFSGDFGQGPAAQLSGPRGVAVDANDNIYIADTGNDRVRRVTPDGMITTYAGGGPTGQPNDGDGGPPVDAYVQGPEDVAVDAEGRLLTIRSNPQRIRRISADGFVITTVVDMNPPIGCSAAFAGFLSSDENGRVHFGMNCNGPSAKQWRIESDDSLTEVGTFGSLNCGVPELTHVNDDGYIRTLGGLGFVPDGRVWMTELGGYCGENRLFVAKPDFSIDTHAWSGTYDGPTDWVDSMSTGLRGLGQVIFHPIFGVVFSNQLGTNIHTIRAIAGTEVVESSSLSLRILNSSGVQSAPINDQVPLALAVRAEDAAGDPVSAIPLSFSSDDGSVYLETPNQTTINGLASTLAHVGLDPTATSEVVATATPWRGAPATATFSLSVETPLVGNAYAVVNPTSVAATSLPGGLSVYHSSRNHLGRPHGVSHLSDGSFVISTDLCSVWQVTPGGLVTRIAGTTSCGNGAADGDALTTHIRAAGSIAVNGAGEVAFVEHATIPRVRLVRTDGTMTVAAGGVSSACTGDGNLAINASLTSPVEIAYAPNGDLYIADTACGSIRKVDAGTQVISTFANLDCNSVTPDDYDVAAITGGVAVDGLGRVYFSGETGTSCPSAVGPGQVVYRVDPATPGVAEILAGAGASPPDGALAADASFTDVGNISVSGDIVFIADRGTDQIFSLDVGAGSDGRVHLVAGDGSAAAFVHPEDALLTSIQDPLGMSVGPDGNLYFADNLNGAIRMVVLP